VAGSPKKRLRKILAAVDEEGLDPETRLFCDYYVQHHDLHKAIRQAYGGSRNAQKIITRPEVIAAIKRREEYVKNRFQLSTEWIVQQLLYKSGARKRDLFDEEGNLLPVTQWPDYLDAAISSIDFEDLYEKDEDGKRKKVGKVLKCRFYNTNESDALLMRHLGIDHMPSQEGRDRLHELVQVFKAGPVPRLETSKTEEKK
jgi:phage terminase small subunit